MEHLGTEDQEIQDVGIVDDGSYNADSIKILEGLEAVRVRPAMYIGSTGLQGLHHLVYEVVDNSIDEAMAGFCTKIKVIIHFDNSVTVIDNGRGIPVDMHKEEGRSAAEVVMTTLHAGGKFDKNSYSMSGGLHGVGVSCVNALSTRLDLEIKKDGFIYFQKYETGKPVTELSRIGETTKRGTKITFWPDEDIFETCDFDYKILAKRLKELAFLNAGIKISLIDERDNNQEVFHYEGGISQYVSYLAQGKEKIHENPIVIRSESDEGVIEIAFQYIQSYQETMLSFVNNINTVEGGTHLTGFKGALTRTINAFAQNNQLFKKDFKGPFSGEDVREGLTAVVSVRIREPQFEGQTKGKLGNSEVKGWVESFVNEKLYEFFDENFSVAKGIIMKSLLAAQAREASRRAKDLVRKTSLLESTSLPGKLADCQSKDPAVSEIFIVEGDSAGGSAKQGRDRRFQAILPLKGKILNVEKASTHKMLENGEIKTIVAALGVGIGKELFDVEKLRYHKIIIMTDADVDGSHIRTLIMTFFFRHMRDIVERGHLYLAQPPLYLVKKGRERVYLKNEKELENFLIERMGEDFQVRNGDHSVSGKDLIRWVRIILKRNKLLENISKRGFSREITEFLIAEVKDESTFRHEDHVRLLADRMLEKKLCSNAVVGFDPEYKTFTLTIRYELNGVRQERLIDWDFLTGPFFAEINEVFEKLQDYPSFPCEVGQGSEAYEASDPDSMVNGIFERVKKGLSIQRYKGLGEMNPDQLWETTMDPQNRLMLRVNINDAMESELIFETLMGNDAQKRKEFIFANAMNVRNLDV